MKTVCIDINSIIPLFIRGYLSGIGRTTYELINAIADIQDNNTVKFVLYTQNIRGIKYKILNNNFSNKHLYFPYRDKYNLFLSKFPIKEKLIKYDLIHVPHNFEYLNKPEKSIITLHDALFMRLQEKMFDHKKMKLQVPPLMHKCKSIITCSENSKNDIIETMGVHPDKIEVIPWGIRHDVFFPDNNEEKLKKNLFDKFNINNPYFLSVSCNMERKNTPRLLDVYIKLAKQGLKNDLCLVWDAPEEIHYKINKSGIQERVHFFKNINDNDLRQLYCGATATVFPSLYEGFGLPLLESMACGTPVISSNTSSLPEIGKDVPVYIDPLDNQSIENALISFDSSSLDLSIMIARGIERAAEFTWDKCARRTLDIYNKNLMLE